MQRKLSALRVRKLNKSLFFFVSLMPRLFALVKKHPVHFVVLAACSYPMAKVALQTETTSAAIPPPPPRDN